MTTGRIWLMGRIYKEQGQGWQMPTFFFLYTICIKNAKQGILFFSKVLDLVNPYDMFNIESNIGGLAF